MHKTYMSAAPLQTITSASFTRLLQTFFLPNYPSLKLTSSHKNLVSTEVVSMQAFGVLWNANKADSMLKGWEFLPPEEWDLQGFMILPCIFKPVSQESWFVKGVLKLSCCYSFWLGWSYSALQTVDQIPVCHTWEQWTAHATKSLQPTCHHPRPSKNSFNMYCTTPDRGTEVPLPPCQTKTRHPKCTKVYRVGKYGDVWLWSNSHFRGSSDCAPAKVLQPEAHMRDLQLCTLLLL